MQFICSSIQAGSRLGYQESAELCAQYLAPILDAIKFNYFPFGLELVQHRRDAAQGGRLLRAAAASAEMGTRTPPSPGIWVAAIRRCRTATPNTGWIVAPGMQGQQVGPVTAGLMTPDSLAELMGGPNIEPVQSDLQTPPGPPNAYDEQPGATAAGPERPGADPAAATRARGAPRSGRSDAGAGVGSGTQRRWPAAAR